MSETTLEVQGVVTDIKYEEITKENKIIGAKAKIFLDDSQKYYGYTEWQSQCPDDIVAFDHVRRFILNNQIVLGSNVRITYKDKTVGKATYHNIESVDVLGQTQLPQQHKQIDVSQIRQNQRENKKEQIITDWEWACNVAVKQYEKSFKDTTISTEYAMEFVRSIAISSFIELNKK